MSRVQNKDVDNSDLFGDIKDSFKQAGASDAESDTMTWNVVGLIATAGPNLGAYLARISTPDPTDVLKVSLATIAGTSPILDELSLASGHIYTYPPGIKSTCDSGKPYHFWLAAYIAHQMAQNSSVEAAAAAAFSAEKGYQMFSSTSNRDPTEPFLDPLFSPYNNTIRADLAYASAGALYGAREAKGFQTSLNVDLGLVAIIKAARPVGGFVPRHGIEKISLSQAGQMVISPSLEFLSDWDQIFAPNKAFVLYKKTLSGE